MPDKLAPPNETPWGPKTDHTELEVEGIFHVGTRGRSSYWVTPERLAEMPEAFRKQGQWFDNEMEYNMLHLTFPAAFTWMKIEESTQYLIDSKPDTMRAAGYEFADNDSRTLRGRQFDAEHKDEYIVTDFLGQWSNETPVPNGMFGVIARVGGKAGPGPDALFLVPRGDIQSAGGGDFKHFVIDPARHTAVPGTLKEYSPNPLTQDRPRLPAKSLSL